MLTEAHILVVDDNNLNLEIVNRVLEKEGYKITLCAKGINAISIIKEKRPDLILLDILMPDINGFAVCNQLVEDKETRDIPVIFLTSMDETNNIVKGFQVGAVDYITKPYHKEELLARVRNHLELKLMRDSFKQLANDNKTSRNAMMSVLLNYGKKVNKES